MVAPVSNVDALALPDWSRAATPLAPPLGGGYERPVGVLRVDRTDSVDVQISDAARQAALTQPTENPLLQSFAQALAQGMQGLGRQASSMFTLLGMTPGRATLAAGALTQAIRGVAGSPPFHAEVISFAASGRSIGADMTSYRASLIIQKAGIAWDPATNGFVVTMRRMALSVGLDDMLAIVPRGLPEASAAGTQPIIQLDATIPLEFP